MAKKRRRNVNLELLAWEVKWKKMASEGFDLRVDKLPQATEFSSFRGCST